MLKKYLALMAAMLLAATLSGCGSSGGSGGDGTVAPPGDKALNAGVQAASLPVGGAGNNLAQATVGTPTAADNAIKAVGAVVCINCHEGFSWSAAIVSAYLGGAHVLHSTGIDQTTARASGCAKCHDPIGDGLTLESRVDAAYVPAGGLAVVGCEACHGAGGNHYGTGPIPNFNPDYEVCGQCHNAIDTPTTPIDHVPYHPIGNNILDNYKLSKHHTGTVRNSDYCMRCHSDEGYRTYIELTVGLDKTELEAAMAAKPAVGTDPIQCRTCHDPHSNSLRLAATIVNRDSNGAHITDTTGKDTDDNNVRLTAQAFSASFNLCTSCHMNFLTYTWDQAAQKFTYMQDTTKTLQHSGGLGGVVHFDDPATPAVEGFNINAGDEFACLNCHDPHGATKFTQAEAVGIAEEWGNTEGFHGDYKGPAFEHGCTPCHTPLGIAALAKGAAYAEVSTEVRSIGCVGCHDLQNRNAANDGFELGVRRILPEFAFKNARTLYEEAIKTDPNATLSTVEGLGDSALCMTCHSGRESTASVDAKIAATPGGPYTFSNIHYLAAGATLFGNLAKGGYEYAGKSYSSKFEHVDSNDLCVECHNVHSGHLYLTSPGTGQTGCDNCHTNVVDTGNYETDVLAVRDIRMAGSYVDYDGDGNTTEGMYYEVQGLQDILLAEIQAYALNTIGTGIDYDPSAYPYFYEAGTTTQYKKFDAKLLRAAYNLQVSIKDPGSYAHNGTYIIELLYDSIEDLGGLAAVSGLTRDAEGHFNAADEPFRHWDSDGEVEFECSRCHSSEGAAYFLDPTQGNGATLISQYQRLYTKGISAGLACEVCHQAPFGNIGGGTPADPARRQPTQVIFPSGVVLTADGANGTVNASAFFLNDSKLCMTCHQGRSSTDTVNDRIAAGNIGFSNIHYFAAAASFFGNEVRGGYQYAGKTYADRMTFPAFHDGFGFTTCAGCHMSGAPTHDFTPDVVNICGGCHGFVAGAPAQTAEYLAGSPNMHYNDIQTLKAELATVLANSGVTFLPGYPYFENITNAAQTKAAYNWQVADKEPCGFIHNPYYIKQLLYDSIVDLSGGTVTPSVPRP